MDLEIIIAVDLDGSLVLTDTLHESALRFLRDRPLHVLALPLWLLGGKAALKERLAKEVHLDPVSLPYNTELLEWLRVQKSQGRKLVLCTATNQHVAHAIAQHLNLFDLVFASDGKTNLAGRQKKALLTAHFGERRFDYVGNSEADLDVWAGARKAILVNTPSDIAAKVAQLTVIDKTFQSSSAAFPTLRRVLRVHQWLKNLLLFVPLLAAHQITNVQLFELLSLAFVSFNLSASAVYITNDLLDLDSDRLHPLKRHRPFAAGLVPLAYGPVLASTCVVLSLGLALAVGMVFTGWLIVYLALTLAYSLRLKRYALIDCLTLAALYTLRIVAGAAAVVIPLSFWLLAFSIFLFLSLAFVKRYAELQVQQAQGNAWAHGRGYLVTDAPLVQTLGVAAGYAAVVVLALYVHGESVVKLYGTPEYIWGSVPLMLFWNSWVWMKAHRGQMHEDPIIFAMKDKISWVVALGVALFFITATLLN